ncbi:heavy-metal-associated domain-containing protein [Eggerthia catenaformis]|uniref:heavy-metal-associated domain-containing protein n=1 Tax=Eggerthia catenaformis TaxID=31973 RepID=UPI0028EC10FC|nr:heavy metal-associated domain-containing protein [Eggerthia catenaformis]
MATIIIGAIIAVAFVYGMSRLFKESKEGCCSGGCTVDKIKVKDRNKSHYQYTTIFKVSDMHCSNCATKVENALNSQEDTYASANLSKGEVKVLTKQSPDIKAMEESIRTIGYHSKLIS